tara:strand:- start:137 stop:649 length:513 start_codon:yes stop_codon:yes gene_type:complete
MIKFLIIILNLFISKNVFSNTWSIIEQYDDFTETSFKYIQSNWVEPNKPLNFPYDNLKASFWRYCEGNKNYFNIEFNELMQLKSTSYMGDGMFYKKSRYKVNINMDGKIIMTSGEKDPTGTTFAMGMYITDPDKDDLDKILFSNELKIQFDFTSGKRHFNFDLSELPKSC